MNIILILIGVGVGLVVARVVWGSGRGNLDAANAVRQARKEAEKAKVLGLFGQANTEITNNEVEQALGVSHATATNYLTELEAEGKVVQVGGQDGPSVRYHLKP